MNQMELGRLSDLARSVCSYKTKDKFVIKGILNNISLELVVVLNSQLEPVKLFGNSVESGDAYEFFQHFMSYGTDNTHRENNHDCPCSICVVTNSLRLKTVIKITKNILNKIYMVEMRPFSASGNDYITLNFKEIPPLPDKILTMNYLK